MCVKNSVHMAGGHVWWGTCMTGGVHGRGHAWWGEHAWQGTCVAGGMCGRGACMAGGVCMARGACVAGGHAWYTPPRRYYEIRSMSGRYASYWNAFLLFNCSDVQDVLEMMGVFHNKSISSIIPKST